jgi:hypothetical protein
MKKLACALVVVAACGGTISTTDGGTDASTDATSPLDASAFCTGSSPKLVINGADVPIMNTTGKAIILNCCDAAELTLATSAYQALLNLMWRAPAGPGATTIDLASPPQGFTIELDLGCDPSTTSCATASPEERYTDGFSGTIQYATGNGPMSVSYCVQVAESPTQPHGTIHSMMLYAPSVPSP